MLVSPSASVINKAYRKTLLGYEITLFQDALVNYFIPSICACMLYISILACDIGVIFRHYKDDQPIWATLTILFIFAPSIGSYVVIISDWDLWPESIGCGGKNLEWAILKTLEHILSPIWQLWRFGERIFWSIDALICSDDYDRAESMEQVYAPRNIELLVFLQSYLHALPQILLQFYILMRHEKDISKTTADIQIASIVMNLIKVSVTTTYFQRFKTQKLAGKQYPWFKYDKKEINTNKSLLPVDSNVQLRKNVMSTSESEINAPSTSIISRRRSSDFYMEPSDPDKKLSTLDVRINPNPVYNIERTEEVKGLSEDDIAGKLVAILWWFTFLLARILTITTFQYFFPKEIIYILISHFTLIIAFLLYDVKSDAINRSKSLFFFFIGIIYIFCIIEFKIKFKKASFIYYGYFVLVFLENLIMCIIWYDQKLESLQTDFWFRYIFYIVLMCSLTSFSSMLFYMLINKPKKVVVGTIIKKS